MFAPFAARKTSSNHHSSASCDETGGAPIAAAESYLLTLVSIKIHWRNRLIALAFTTSISSRSLPTKNRGGVKWVVGKYDEIAEHILGVVGLTVFSEMLSINKGSGLPMNCRGSSWWISWKYSVIFWICAQNLRPHPIRAIEMIRSNRTPFSTKFVRPLKWVFWWVLLLSRICQEYRWRSQSIYQIVPTCSSLRPKTPKNPLKIPEVKTWAFSVLFSNYVLWVCVGFAKMLGILWISIFIYFFLPWPHLTPLDFARK